jgi:hypothetical protein
MEGNIELFNNFGYGNENSVSSIVLADMIKEVRKQMDSKKIPYYRGIINIEQFSRWNLE